MKTETILNEISSDISFYLKSGKLNIDSLSNKIDPSLNINNIEKLLRIHFLLKDDVVNFVEKLESRLRSIKTTVETKTTVLNGKIRGSVNWKETISARCSNGYNKSIFVCSLPEKQFSIPENIVLKKILSIFNDIIENDLELAFKKEYDWLNKWVDDKKLKEVLKKTFLKNIYLRKIKYNEEREINNKFLVKALSSRKPIYQDAAELLSKYNSLMNHELNKKEAKELLRNTFVCSENKDLLFELYWIIKIIKSFDNAKLNILEEGSSLVASWKVEDKKYKLYHDSTGSKILNFNEKLEDNKDNGKDNFILREIKVLEKVEELTSKTNNGSLWGGRPDILLEEWKDEKLISVFVGEVKNTKSKDYAMKGLRELLEYVALIRKGKGYVVDKDELFKKDMDIVKGALFTDIIEGFEITDDDNIKYYQFREEEKLSNNFNTKFI